MPIATLAGREHMGSPPCLVTVFVAHHGAVAASVVASDGPDDWLRLGWRRDLWRELRRTLPRRRRRGGLPEAMLG